MTAARIYELGAPASGAGPLNLASTTVRAVVLPKSLFGL